MIFVINSAGECTRFFCHIAVLAGVSLWLSEAVGFIMDGYSRGGYCFYAWKGFWISLLGSHTKNLQGADTHPGDFR